jgi:hypothetical protein
MAKLDAYFGHLMSGIKILEKATASILPFVFKYA